MCVQYVSFGSKVRPRPGPLGELPWVIQCCCFLCPDCSIFRRVWSASCFVLIWCEIVMFCPSKNFM